MDREKPLDCLIEDWLEALELSRLSDWDLLVFLYRHGASLASAGQIARLLGYTSDVVGDALDRLESQGLVKRSRASQGVHLYQFLRSTAISPDDFQRLLNLAENRIGRLLLTQTLRQRHSRQARESRLNLVVKGGKTWPKTT